MKIYREEIEISKIAATLLSGYHSNSDTHAYRPTVSDAVLEAYEIIKSTKELLEELNKQAQE